MATADDIDQQQVQVTNAFDGHRGVKTIAQIGASITAAVTSPITFSGGVTITVGTATPEGAVTAPVGSLFLRTDGSTSTTLYVKTAGSENTGWTAK